MYIIGLSLSLLIPFFSLPRPVNVSSIPWKAELLFSGLLLIGSAVLYRRNSFSSVPFSVDLTTLCAAMLGAWSLITAIWSDSWFAALHHAFVWANYASILILTFLLVAEQKGLDLVIRVAVFVSLIIASLAVFDFLFLVDFQGQEGTIRIRYAKFAEMLATVAPVLFALALYRRGLRNALTLIVPATAAWIGVMLSLSKGAFIAGVAGFAVFFLCTMFFSKAIFRQRVAIVFVYWLILTIAFQVGFSKFTEIPSTSEYISGSADETRSTSNMRIFTWKVALEMIRQNPASGVGADNFGLAFNKARVSYYSTATDEIDDFLGEDYIFERAHNEPLQMAAELGAIGLLIFLVLVLSAGYFLFRALFLLRGRCSPVFVASIAGLVAFAISSMFSSFSFRAFQNGAVFFAILGTAFALSPVKRRSNLQKANNAAVSGISPTQKLIFQTTVIAAVLLALYSFSKGLGYYSAYYAERARTAEESKRLFDLSVFFDPDLTGSYLSLAGMAAKRNEWGVAAENYRKAIDGGLGISLIYSYLADAQAKNGDRASAVATLREGVAIFPGSIFLRARLSQTLLDAGLTFDSQVELELARAIDARQTNSWFIVLTNGILTAHLRSQVDDSYAKPYELLPVDAIAFYAGGIDELPGATP